MSLVEQYLENVKMTSGAANFVDSELSFNETLSPQLFFAMSQNLDDLEFVKQAGQIFWGRTLQPTEIEYFRSEVAALRITRNEFLSILRFSAEGKAHSKFTNVSLYFWRYYRFMLKATHRIPKLGPTLSRVLELPRLLLVLSRLPRRLEELESELRNLKHSLKDSRFPQ